MATPDPRIEAQAAAWRCLTSSPRFQHMTIKEAVAEMANNGLLVSDLGRTDDRLLDSSMSRRAAKG